MNFQSRYQHTEDQFKLLIELFQKKESTIKESLFIATEVTQHGFPFALAYITRLEAQLEKNELKEYLSSLKKQIAFIEAIPKWKSIRNNLVNLKNLYKLNGYHFFRGAKYPSKLLIVFTTMYNNFYLSNPVLIAFLSQFGYSILLLKDATRYNYLRGVEGLGDSLSGVAENIRSLARAEKINDLYITGFSSGSYASLYLSHLIDCTKYIGFSIKTDLSSNSPAHPGKYFTNEVRKQLDSKWLINLKTLLEQDSIGCHRELYVGENALDDIAHAKNIAVLENVHLHELPNCGHVTIARLMETGALTQIFNSIIFERK